MKNKEIEKIDLSILESGRELNYISELKDKINEIIEKLKKI